MSKQSGFPEQAIQLSAEEEEQCRRYGRARFLWGLAEIGVPPGALAALTLSGGAAALLSHAQAAAAASRAHPAYGHLVYLLLIGLLTRAVLFPIHYFKEHWLDHRFGLSRQTFLAWLWEWLARSAVFGAVTVLVLFPVVETLRWWPWLALLWCALFVVGRTWFYEYVYYPLVDAFYPARFLRYETFALPGVGKRTLPVYQVRVSHKTSRVNAQIRMRGRRTGIYVTDTLIDEFTDGEERVVMAHEFGHLYDQLHLEEKTRAGIAQARRKLMLGMAQLLAGFVSLLLLHLFAPRLGLAGVSDLTGFPLLAAMTLGLAHVLSPLVCAEARRDEEDADEYALAITGDVENYCSVMRKLRRLNLEEGDASPLSRFLFDTHPSYRERVNLAARYRRRHHRARKSPHWRGWRHIQRHGRR